MKKMNEAEFLNAKTADIIFAWEDEIAKVFSFVGGSIGPEATSLFQVANFDSGKIKFVYVEEVKQILFKTK